MKKLTLYPVSGIDELAWPEEMSLLSLQTPAVEFFTDFCFVEPLVIDSSVAAVQARDMMIKTHVRLKFVVDKDNDFIGVISADDLAERKLVQKVAEGFRREDIAVTDLMTPKADLMALGMADVERATIGDVVSLLKDSHQQHCLVVEPAMHKVRGIFSSSDISRKLKLPIDIQDRSDFYRVFSAIR